MSLNDWAYTEDERAAIDEEQDLENQINIEVEVDGTVKKLKAIETSIEDINNLYYTMKEQGGMSKSIASEAMAIIPDTKELFNPNRYSTEPSNVGARIAMEGFFSSIKELIKKAIAKIKELIKRFWNWLTGKSNKKNDVKEHAKKQEEAVKEAENLLISNKKAAETVSDIVNDNKPKEDVEKVTKAFNKTLNEKDYYFILSRKGSLTEYRNLFGELIEATELEQFKAYLSNCIRHTDKLLKNENSFLPLILFHEKSKYCQFIFNNQKEIVARINELKRNLDRLKRFLPAYSRSLANLSEGLLRKDDMKYEEENAIQDGETFEKIINAVNEQISQLVEFKNKQDETLDLDGQSIASIEEEFKKIPLIDALEVVYGDLHKKIDKHIIHLIDTNLTYCEVIEYGEDFLSDCEENLERLMPEKQGLTREDVKVATQFDTYNKLTKQIYTAVRDVNKAITTAISFIQMMDKFIKSYLSCNIYFSEINLSFLSLTLRFKEMANEDDTYEERLKEAAGHLDTLQGDIRLFKDMLKKLV